MFNLLIIVSMSTNFFERRRSVNLQHILYLKHLIILMMILFQRHLIEPSDSGRRLHNTKRLKNPSPLHINTPSLSIFFRSIHDFYLCLYILEILYKLIPSFLIQFLIKLSNNKKRDNCFLD